MARPAFFSVCVPQPSRGACGVMNCLFHWEICSLVRLVSFLEAKAEHLHRGAHHYTGVSLRCGPCPLCGHTGLVWGLAECMLLRLISVGACKLGSCGVNSRLANLIFDCELTYMQRLCLFFFSPKLLKLQERVLNGVVIHLLGDEDPRVRHVAAASLVRYLPGVSPLSPFLCSKRGVW